MKARDIREALTQFKRVTVVGLSPNPARPSHSIARFLIAEGYEIVGVNPGQEQILGRPVYASVAQVPGPLEIVDVFRSSDSIPALVDELIPLKPKVLWLQEGVTHPVAEEKARQAGITVFSDLCILKEHIALNL